MATRQPRIAVQPPRKLFEHGRKYDVHSCYAEHEYARRPQSAIVGLGERDGAAFEAPGGAGAGGRFAQPAGKALTKGEVAAMLLTPVERFDARAEHWRPPLASAVAAREIWADDLQNPPRYCTACSGGHSSAKAKSPFWAPYQPRERLQGMHSLVTPFAVAFAKGHLPVRHKAGEALDLEWLCKSPKGALVPETMTPQQYREALVLAFHGAREGHEPYRHLATQLIKALLIVGQGATAARRLDGAALLRLRAELIIPALPLLVDPIRLALNTFEAHLVGHMLTLVLRLLHSHPRVGFLLAPRFCKWLPAIAVFYGRRQAVMLPPPVCLAPTGRRNGLDALDAGARECATCGCPVDKVLGSKMAAAQAILRCQENAAAAADVPPVFVPRLGRGRQSAKFVLHDVIVQVLDAMCRYGGSAGVSAVKRAIPTFDVVPRSRVEAA